MSVLGISVVVLRGPLAGVYDFTSYWAAGQQLIRGANPYSASAISILERSHANNATAKGKNRCGFNAHRESAIPASQGFES